MTATIEFHPPDTGDAQIARGFCTSGTFDGWCEAVEPLRDYPRAAVAIYASLSAAMLWPAHMPNYAVDWAGVTSSGKTTTLRVGASCFGQPDERADNSLIHAWDMTKVFAGRRAGTLHDAPFLVDDSARAKWPKDVTDIVYMIANGRDRERGSRQGVQETKRIRTVLLSTGEQSLTTFAKKGGVDARVIPIWGAPFGQTSDRTVEVVRRVNLGVLEHYGHAAPMFIRYLQLHHHEWSAFRVAYRQSVAAWTARAGDNTVVERRAGYFAALDFTAHHVHSAIPRLPWDYEHAQTMINDVWSVLLTEPEPDRAAEALRHAVSWAASNENRFQGREADASHPPYAGWAGRWSPDEDWAHIAFLPLVIDDILKTAGYEPDAIVRQWKDRGWLKLDPEGKHPHMRVGGGNPRLVTITRKAAEETGAHGRAESEEYERPASPLPTNF